MGLFDDALDVARRHVDDRVAVLEGQANNADIRAVTAESNAAALRVELGAQVAKYDALKAEFDAYKAAHPDEKPPVEEPAATAFGATPGQWPIPGVQRVPVLRVYLGPGEKPNTFPASWSSQSTDGGVIWFSWKVDDPAWLDRFLATKPANRVLVGTFNHEPENDVPADVAGYQAAWARALPVLRKHGVKAATCLLGHLSDAENDPWHVPGVDIAGFDRYNPGLGDAKTYADPVKVFARCLAFGRKKGLPIAFGETGTIVVPGSTAADRAAWAKKVRDHLASQPDVPYVCWWNQSKMTIDQPVSDAWFA